MNWALCREDVGGSGGIPSTFLTSAPSANKRTASSPCRFTRLEGVPGTDCIGCCVGRWYWEAKRFILVGNHTPNFQPTASRHTDWGIPNPKDIKRGISYEPKNVAEQLKAWHVLACLNTRIVTSTPIRGMISACVSPVFAFSCVYVAALQKGWPSVQGTPPTFRIITRHCHRILDEILYKKHNSN